jgi:hypothetical protein
MMTVGPRSVPAGTGGSKRDGGAGERSGSERDGGVEEPRNSSSEDDVEVFGDGRDRLRRRGRPRVPRRASWNASFGTQTRALWGGSTGRRRQSWGGAGLTTLLQSPCSQGRVGPVGGSPGQPTSAGQPSPVEVQPSPPVMQANPPEVQPVKRSRRVCLKKNGNWADHQLRAAMAAVDQGCPVQTAALDYEIPRSTLRCHVMGQSLSRKRGRKPVLSTVEEEKLVKYIMGMARYGHPLNITELKIKVAEATQLRETPGAGWLRWFRKRHPEISLRMSQGLDAGRARGLCPSHVATFYDNMELMLTRGYEASHIWNWMSLMHKPVEMVVEGFWPRLGRGVSTLSFQRSGSGCRFWFALMRPVITSPASTSFVVRASNEIILSSVRTMHLWPCKQKHG